MCCVDTNQIYIHTRTYIHTYREAKSAADAVRPMFTSWLPDFGEPLEKLTIAIISADFNIKVGACVLCVYMCRYACMYRFRTTSRKTDDRHYFGQISTSRRSCIACGVCVCVCTYLCTNIYAQISATRCVFHVCMRHSIKRIYFHTFFCQCIESHYHNNCGFQTSESACMSHNAYIYALHIYIYIYIYIYISAAKSNIHIHIFTQTYIHTCMHMCPSSSYSKRVWVHGQAHTPYIHIYIYTHTNKQMHTWSKTARRSSHSECVYFHAQIHTSIHTYMWIHTHTWRKTACRNSDSERVWIHGQVHV